MSLHMELLPACARIERPLAQNGHYLSRNLASILSSLWCEADFAGDPGRAQYFWLEV
jgi:hypothetical protein